MSVRPWAYRFVKHKWFEGAVLFVILLNSVAIGVDSAVPNAQYAQCSPYNASAAGGPMDPVLCNASNATDPLPSARCTGPEAARPGPHPQWHCTLALILRICDLVFTICFTIEMVLKMVAFGIFFHVEPDEAAYLRSPWSILDFIIVITSWLSFLPALKEVSFMKLLRVLKPLRTINQVQGIRLLVNSLVSSFPMIMDAVLLIAFIFFAFALIAMQLWMGIGHHRCLDAAGAVRDDGQLCTNSSLGRRCPDGYTCREWPGGPEAPLDYAGQTWVNDWDHIGTSMMFIFQTMTQDNWSGVCYKAMDGWSMFAAAFFVLLTLFGTGVSLNLFLAVISDKFAENADKQRRKEALVREQQKLRLSRVIALRRSTDVTFHSWLQKVARRKRERAAAAAAGPSGAADAPAPSPASLQAPQWTPMPLITESTPDGDISGQPQEEESHAHAPPPPPSPLGDATPAPQLSPMSMARAGVRFQSLGQSSTPALVVTAPSAPGSASSAPAAPPSPPKSPLPSRTSGASASSLSQIRHKKKAQHKTEQWLSRAPVLCRKCYALVSTKYFEWFITAMIVVAVIAMACEYKGIEQTWDGTCPWSAAGGGCDDSYEWVPPPPGLLLTTQHHSGCGWGWGSPHPGPPPQIFLPRLRPINHPVGLPPRSPACWDRWDRWVGGGGSNPLPLGGAEFLEAPKKILVSTIDVAVMGETQHQQTPPPATHHSDDPPPPTVHTNRDPTYLLLKMSG